MLLRITVFIILGYLVLVAFLFLMQRRLLYMPEPAEPAPAWLAEQGLAFWPEANDRFRGFLGTGAPGDARGTMVVFHGNAGAAWHRGYYADALQPLGFRVVLAEYPGYGGRPGEPAEASLTRDARETVSRVRAQFGDPVYVWGESLGAAVAAAVAGHDKSRVAGVVLITAWDSLARLAQTHYPYVPARWLVRDRFDSVAYLEHYNGPVALVVAARDTMVPREHSMRLYQSISTRKNLWVMDEAGHNSWPTAPGHPWWREVSDFIQRQPALTDSTASDTD